MQTDYDYLFKILALGPSGVGKTSIVMRFVDDVFYEELLQTIGVDLKIKTLPIEGSVCKLQLWDAAGQEKFREIVQTYYRKTKVILLVFDITNRDSFEDLIREYREHIMMNVSTGRIVYAVVGNKSDLNVNRQISQEEGQYFAKELNCYYTEISSKDNKGISELFEVIIKEAKKVVNDESANKEGTDKQ